MAVVAASGEMPIRSRMIYSVTVHVLLMSAHALRIIHFWCHIFATATNHLSLSIAGVVDDSCAAFVDDYVYQTLPAVPTPALIPSPLENKYSALLNKTCADARSHIPVRVLSLFMIFLSYIRFSDTAFVSIIFSPCKQRSPNPSTD